MKTEETVAEEREMTAPQSSVETMNATEADDAPLPALNDRMLKPLRVKLGQHDHAVKEIAKAEEMRAKRQEEAEKFKAEFAEVEMAGKPSAKILEEVAQAQIRLEVMPRILSQLEGKREAIEREIADEIGRVLPVVLEERRRQEAAHEAAIRQAWNGKCKRALERGNVHVDRAIEILTRNCDLGLELWDLGEALSRIYMTDPETRARHAVEMSKKLIASAERLLALGN